MSCSRSSRGALLQVQELPGGAHFPARMETSRCCTTRVATRAASACLSAASGSLFGLIICLLVDDALVEISLNVIFSIIFGLILVALALIIVRRMLTQPLTLSVGLVIGFAGLVLASGVCCFVLDRQLVQSLSPRVKTPMYALLGVALSFALTFSVVDLLNVNANWMLHRSVVSSSTQICLVLVASICLGAYFGLLFGSFDVEDDRAFSDAYRRDRMYSLPVGAAVGALVGLLNAAAAEAAH